jgi:alanine dehydrogenase
MRKAERSYGVGFHLKAIESRETLVLGKKEVESLLTMNDALAAVERAFGSDYEMPSKIYVEVKKYAGDFRAMPAWIEPYAGVKWVNVHPNNPKTHGLPSVMAVIILSDPKTGFPLAVLDGTTITNYRTGAAGGVAAKHLARKNAHTLGLVGAGVQAHLQALAVSLVRDIKTIKVFDLRPEASQKLVQDLRGKIKADFRIASSAREACDADIVCTTVPSTKPIVEDAWLKPGTHVNEIGADAPGKQALEIGTLKRAKIVVDRWEQASHSGAINVGIESGKLTRKDVAGEIKDVVLGKIKRENDGELTVFDSTGLAIQDVATAGMVYEKAVAKKIGLRVNFL